MGRSIGGGPVGVYHAAVGAIPSEPSSKNELPGAVMPPGSVRSRGRYLTLLWLLFCLILLAANVSSVLFYASARREVDAELGDRLIAIATTLAQTVGERGLDELSAGTPSTAPGLRSPVASAELERIARGNALDNIVILDAEGVCVADLRDSSAVAREHPLLQLYPEVSTTLVSGLPASTPLTQARAWTGDFLKAGVAPIEDDAGAVLGAVVVEGGSGFFSILARQERRAWWVAATSMGLVLLLAALFVRTLRGLVLLERSLRRQSALVAIGQISALVAHEIKNPLAIIRSRAERVQKKIDAGRPKEEILEWFEVIPREVDRLDRILTNYLSLARPGESGVPRCAPALVLRDTLALVDPELQKRGIRRELDPALDPEAPAAGTFDAAIEARALHQVFLNLILNAAQAMENGGTLRLRGRALARTVELEVEDDGPGMDEATRRRVTEPFFTTKPTGSGLGLTLVSSLLDARGGRLDLRSAPGSGTTARISLPRATGKDRG